MTLNDDQVYNDGTIMNVTSWQWENIKMPPMKLNSRIQFHSEFDRMEGVVELANVRVHTQQKCWPKWVELKGYGFIWADRAKFPKRYRHSLREYEYTAVDATILDKLTQGFSTTYGYHNSFEHCAR